MEKISLSPEEEIEAQKDVQKMKGQNPAVKIRDLLALVQTKGIEYALKVAEKDPYLLDLLHDALAENELFQKYLKKD